jgi:hypothetical protein
MSDTTTERLPKYTGQIPGKGTFAMAANTLLYKGQIVTQDSAGRAAVPGVGQNAVGISSATYNNRTGAPSGGTAGAINAEVEYGVHGLAISGTTPKPGQVVYVVDNQTVSLDPTGSRGIAGIVSESKTATGDDGLCYVFMGPLAIAMAQALQGGFSIDLPLNGFRLDTGAAIPAFSAGAADGLTLADSEAFSLRINDDSTTAFWTSCKLPESMPAGAVVTLHVLASRIGATDVAAELLTAAVFANREGVAYDAGAGLTTGNFALMAGATKVVHERTLTITGAQAGDALSVKLLAVAAGLANDDLVIHSVWISIR